MASIVAARATLLSAIAAGTLLISACELGPLGRSGSAPAAAPAEATPAAPARPTAVVRRGTIAETIKGVGRVVPSKEADLYFRTAARLRSITIETGQEVRAGQVLAELESGDLQIKAAQQAIVVDIARLKLEQASARVVLGDATANGAVIGDAQSVEAARVALDQSVAGQEQQQQGATAADVATAEASVVQAQVRLQQARGELAAKEAQLAARQADLAARLTGPSPAELASARAALVGAWAQVQNAGSATRPEDVRSAEIKLESAQMKLETLQRGAAGAVSGSGATDATSSGSGPATTADPQVVANAALTVRQSELAVEQARADGSGTVADRETRLRQAQLALEKSRNDLARLQQQGPTPWDIRLAQLEVTAAELALTRLRNPAPYDAAAARAKYDQAMADLETLQRGPSEADLAELRAEITALEHAVQGAQVGIPAAEAAITAADSTLAAEREGASELDRRATQLEVEKARAQLAASIAALDVAGRERAIARSAESLEVRAAAGEMETAQLALTSLQEQIAETRIVAPFDGKVTRVSGRPGDTVEAFTPVVSLSSPNDPNVQLQLSEANLARLEPGQEAQLSIDAFPGQTFTGIVRQLPNPTPPTTGQTTTSSPAPRGTPAPAPGSLLSLDVDWTKPGIEVGMAARVQLVVQEKPDVLLVPSVAVRSVGQRRFVEYLDGNVKRSRNVEIGIAGDAETEIVTGVEEGMIVLLPA